MPLGNTLVWVFHYITLFAIGAATAWAAGMTFAELWHKPYAKISDLLLLFIYLEIGAMVGIYFQTNHMPVRFLLYIAITALTRHMVDIMTHVPINVPELLAVSAAVLAMAVSVLIIRYTSAKYPSEINEQIN